jgi:hypothetical protein
MPDRVTFSSLVRRWYEGEFVPHENDSDSQVVFIGGWQRRHWTAEVARSIVKFYGQHWQWVWSTIIAVGSLIAAVLALK